MIEEVFENTKDLLGDIKGSIGKNGMIILGIIGGCIALYLVTRSREEVSDYEIATGVASYPDIGENSEVIMGSIGSSIQSAQDEIIDILTGTITETKDEVKEQITESTGTVTDKIENIPVVENPTVSTPVYVPQYVYTSPAPSVVETATKTEVTTTATSAPVTPTTKSTPATTETTASTFTYTAKSGLNTNTSIVDALKATGTDSSFENRKKIAEANGITNYTGSYSQNVSLLNSMKAGTLVDPSGGSSKTTATTKTTSTATAKTTTTTKATTTTATKKSASSSGAKAVTADGVSASTTVPKKTTTTVAKTSYSGNSIVDGLKSVGVDSSYANRKALAEANGIKNYTGTASQNTALLNKLKSGTLKK